MKSARQDIKSELLENNLSNYKCSNDDNGSETHNGNK
jgi:hypothetical protein